MITYSLPSWLAPCNSICHWLLCPIIWLAPNTPPLGELSCVPVHWLIHKQSHYNMYSHISNNKQMAIVRRLICLKHERQKKGIVFAGLCLSTDCFIPRERHLAAEAAKSTQMKDNLVSINFSCGKSTCYEDSKLLRKLPDNSSYGPDRRVQLLTECLSPLTCCDVYQVGWLKCLFVCTGLYIQVGT